MARPESGSDSSPQALDLADFIRDRGLAAEIRSPGVPMPTVDAAAAAMDCPPDHIFKSILFQSRSGECVMVIACGKSRVDVKKVEALTGLARLKLAKPQVVMAVTGYPAGGTPPVGHLTRFPVIVDTGVAAQEWGWGGGGRPELLVKIAASDIIRLNEATVHEVVTA